VHEYLLISDKAIRPTVIPAVTVAEENDPGGIIERDVLRGLEDLGQSPVCISAVTAWDALETLLWNRPCCDSSDDHKFLSMSSL
jgi:hypothetical protein